MLAGPLSFFALFSNKEPTLAFCSMRVVPDTVFIVAVVQAVPLPSQQVRPVGPRHWCFPVPPEPGWMQQVPGQGQVSGQRQVPG